MESPPHPYSMHLKKVSSNSISPFTKFRSGISYISNVSHSLAPLCIEWKFLEGRGQGGAAHTPRPLFVCALSQLWTLKCRDEIHIVEERRTLLCVKGNLLFSTQTTRWQRWAMIHASYFTLMQNWNGQHIGQHEIPQCSWRVTRNSCCLGWASSAFVRVHCAIQGASFWERASRCDVNFYRDQQ